MKLFHVEVTETITTNMIVSAPDEYDRYDVRDALEANRDTVRIIERSIDSPDKEITDTFELAADDKWLVDLKEKAKTDYVSYDTLAECAGIIVGSHGWGSLALSRIGFSRPPGPYRNPMPDCRSGHRPYCTCDACY